NGLGMETGDVGNHVVGMRAGFTEEACFSCLIEPEPPVPAGRIVRFEGNAPGPDAELGLGEAHPPDGACGDHGARLAHHRVAGIAMAQAEKTAATLDQFRERLRLLEIVRHRLLADDIDAAFEESLCYREMKPWRRRNDNDID